jgi:hypothetical protein
MVVKPVAAGVCGTAAKWLSQLRVRRIAPDAAGGHAGESMQ